MKLSFHLLAGICPDPTEGAHSFPPQRLRERDMLS